jgi:hypothetical protein
MTNTDAVDIIKEAFSERKVVDGIKNVCFPDTVITDKTIYFR